MIQLMVEDALNEPYVNIKKINFLQLTVSVNVLKLVQSISLSRLLYQIKHSIVFRKSMLLFH